MSQARAILLMVFITLLWSTAGVVTRHLDSTRGIELSFWRSLITAIALSMYLTYVRGPGFLRSLLRPSQIVWVSGICWAIMLSAFLIALTLTSVANVLIIMSLGPLITALFARLLLKHRLLPITWLAIVVAGFGIVWMFSSGDDASISVLGSCIALSIPLAGALNFTLMQYVGLQKDPVTSEMSSPAHDMEQALLLGALISALATLPLAWPFEANVHDLTLLGMLAVFQVSTPCLLVIGVSRILPAPEITLLSLLEVIFGVTWAWLWAGETISADTLIGGSLVLGALTANGCARIIRERRSRTHSSTRPPQSNYP